MFSDLYYLSKLIDASLSFTQVEKQNIFNHVKNNPDKIKDTIKVFEDERIWLEYIKNDYQKKLVNIWENYRSLPTIYLSSKGGTLFQCWILKYLFFLNSFTKISHP